MALVERMGCRQLLLVTKAQCWLTPRCRDLTLPLVKPHKKVPLLFCRSGFVACSLQTHLPTANGPEVLVTMTASGAPLLIPFLLTKRCSLDRYLLGSRVRSLASMTVLFALLLRCSSLWRRGSDMKAMRAREETDQFVRLYEVLLSPQRYERWPGLFETPF
jgi:hypothetical protein